MTDSSPTPERPLLRKVAYDLLASAEDAITTVRTLGKQFGPLVFFLRGEEICGTVVVRPFGDEDKQTAFKEAFVTARAFDADAIMVFMDTYMAAFPEGDPRRSMPRAEQPRPSELPEHERTEALLSLLITPNETQMVCRTYAVTPGHFEWTDERKMSTLQLTEDESWMHTAGARVLTRPLPPLDARRAAVSYLTNHGHDVIPSATFLAETA